MLLASRVFSLIKILNSSIFYKILGFCAELESLYGNCYMQLFFVTLFWVFLEGRGKSVSCWSINNYLNTPSIWDGEFWERNGIEIQNCFMLVKPRAWALSGPLSPLLIIVFFDCGECRVLCTPTSIPPQGQGLPTWLCHFWRSLEPFLECDCSSISRHN